MSRSVRLSPLEGDGPAWLEADELAAVRGSFERIAADADAVTASFYARLFELDPALRPYFPDDLAAQREKLMLTLARAVASLQRLPALLPDLAELGRRHVAYGARELDYATVGDALLFALERRLGDGWTPAVEVAWEKTFTALSQAMLRGAASREA